MLFKTWATKHVKGFKVSGEKHTLIKYIHIYLQQHKT